MLMSHLQLPSGMHDLAMQLRVIVLVKLSMVLCWHDTGVYDEKVLVGLDFVLNEASKRGIRAVLVLSNYWAMYGGIDQYNIWSFEAGSGKHLPLALLCDAPYALHVRPAAAVDSC